MIQMRYFASLREGLGTGAEEIPAPSHPQATVADILSRLRQRGAPWSEALGEGQGFLIAVNQEMATPATAVREGDEVAFFPPVTGG